MYVNDYFFQISQTMDRGVRTSVGNTVTVSIGVGCSLDLPAGIIANQVRKEITNFVIGFI